MRALYGSRIYIHNTRPHAGTVVVYGTAEGEVSCVMAIVQEHFRCVLFVVQCYFRLLYQTQFCLIVSYSLMGVVRKPHELSTRCGRGVELYAYTMLWRPYEMHNIRFLRGMNALNDAGKYEEEG